MTSSGLELAEVSAVTPMILNVHHHEGVKYLHLVFVTFRFSELIISALLDFNSELILGAV